MDVQKVVFLQGHQSIALVRRKRKDGPHLKEGPEASHGMVAQTDDRRVLALAHAHVGGVAKMEDRAFASARLGRDGVGLAQKVKITVSCLSSYDGPRPTSSHAPRRSMDDARSSMG